VRLCLPPRRRGFTLLELIVAGALMAIGITGTLGALSACASAVVLGQSKTQAVLLAQEKLAEFETLDELTAESSSGDFGEDYPDFEWTATVAAVDDEELPALWQVQVAVQWEALGRPQTYRVEQWFYRPVPTE